VDPTRNRPLPKSTNRANAALPAERLAANRAFQIPSRVLQLNNSLVQLYGHVRTGSAIHCRQTALSNRVQSGDQLVPLGLVRCDLFFAGKIRRVQRLVRRNRGLIAR
jgi:hypothetical protein